MQTLPPVRIGRQRSHDYFNWKNRFYVNFNRYAKRTRHERSKIAQRRYEKQVRLHMARTIAAVEQTGAQRMQQLYEELFGTQAQIKSSLTRTTKWMVNLLMIFVLSGCGALFGDKDKDNAMSIDLTPLEARVSVPFTAELRVTDMDGVGQIRVISPDSSWVYNGEGKTDAVFSFSKEYEQAGNRQLRVEALDVKGREYNTIFDLDVLAKDQNSSFVFWSPRSHELTNIYEPETRVNNQEGVDSVRVTRLDDGFSKLYVGDGGSLLNFDWSLDYSSLRLNAPLSVDHLVEIYGAGDVFSEVVSVDFYRDNVLPSLTVETSGLGVDELSARIMASDDFYLKRVEFDFGSGLESFDINSSSLDTVISRRFDDGAPRDLNYLVRVFDDEGGVSSKTGDFRLLGLADLDVVWRTYLDETPVDGALMQLSHKEIDFDTTLVSVGGRVMGRVPRGEYSVFLHANPSMRLPSKGGPVGFENFVEGNGEYVSNISRIRLGRDFLPSEYNGSFWHGRNETFVLSGPQIMHELQLSILSYEAEKAVILGPGFDVDFYLSLNRNLSTVIETLENNYYSYPVVYRGIRGGYTLEELSRQTANGFGAPRVPLASEPLVFAFNWGDSNCKEGWTSWTDTVCTVGRVPGALASDDVKEGFRLFYRDLTSILDGPKIGINPYLIEMIEGYSEDISGRIIGNPDFFNNLINRGGAMTSSLRNGVLYYGLTNGNIMAENDVRNRGPVYTQDKTLSKILARFQDRYYDAAVSRPAVYAGGAVNESRFIGEVENMFVSEIKESYQEEDIWRIPMFGSSRDPPTIMRQLGFDYLHPDYGVIPVRRTFLDKDVRNIKILHGYAPFAQQQYLTQAIRQQIRDFVIEHGGTEWQSNSLSSSRETGFNMQFYNRYQDIP